MSNRNYCCYRHFKQGKHDKNCTYCFSHVPLGVISPQPQNNKQLIVNAKPVLNIKSKQFRIEHRNHDLNQINKKQSLPQRLRSPKQYTEQIVKKMSRTQPLLPIRYTSAEEFQFLGMFFQKIGKQLPIKSAKSLTQTIYKYSSQKKGQNKSVTITFFTKSEFFEWILLNFSHIINEQANYFWQCSYNQLRFKQKISMNAFVHNFERFYIKTQNYLQTMSQVALRQRMVDLRLILHDWYQYKNIFRYNFLNLKKQFKRVIRDLESTEDNEQKNYDLKCLLEQSRKVCLKYNFFAQTFYNLTDHKFLTKEKITNAVQNTINSKATIIQVSRDFLQKFFQIQNLYPDQNFKITELLQFCKNQNASDPKMLKMVQWMHGIFQFIYYEKQSFDSGIFFNQITNNLECKSILQVNANIIKQYDSYLENLSLEEFQTCNDFNVMLNRAIQKMPDLKGPKKEVTQSNFISQTLLRFLKGISLISIWKMNNILDNFEQGKQISLDKNPKQQQIKKTVKKLFQTSKKSEEVFDLSLSEVSKQNGLDQFLQNYQNPEALSIKLKQRKNEQFQIIHSSKNSKQLQRVNVKPVKQVKAKKIQKAQTKDKKQILENNLQDNIEQKTFNKANWNEKYLLNVSRQTNETINAVSSLQDQLLDLLDLNI